MTPEEKASVVDFMVWEKERMAIAIRFSHNRTISAEELCKKLVEEWHEDIFVCPSCGGCFTWEDSVKVTEDIIDGKARSPSKIICKGCDKYKAVNF